MFSIAFQGIRQNKGAVPEVIHIFGQLLF